MENTYIALENIRSLLNIGAIFRTCSFFGIKNVILLGYSGKDINGKLHPKIARASLGTENDLNLFFMEDAAQLIKFSINNKLELISVEQHKNSIPLNKWQKTRDSIFIFGNEVDGVSEEILSASKQIIEIPRLGVHNSLNVASSVAVVAYSIVKR